MKHSSSNASLYLIPTPLVPDTVIGISATVFDTINELDLFYAERAKTARQFLKKVHRKAIQDLEIVEMDKRDPQRGIPEIMEALLSGRSAGVLSEAGCPGVADPGNLIVMKAHEEGIRVIPLVGPSSILLAMMASGLNGQNFHFKGYLPNKPDALSRSLKQIEQSINRTGQSTIFIETPYRNNNLVSYLLKNLSNRIRLCIAANISSEDEWIKTQSIAEWKKSKVPDLHKIPCMFILG